MGPRGKAAATCTGLLILVMVVAVGFERDSSAQQPEPAGPEAAIGGFVRDEQRRPLQGVEFAVRSGGRVVGRSVTDERGEWIVAVRGPGTYRVTIDPDTLPRRTQLRDPDRTTLDGVEVTEGQVKRVIFALGPPREAGRSDLDRFLNLLVLGTRLGLVLAVASVGLSMIFGLTGLVNFSHGELVTFGALMAYFFADSAGGPAVPLVLATLFAVAAGGVLGFALERGLWRPLRRRRTGNVALIVVSIGLSLLLRHVYLIVFGGRPEPFGDFAIQRAYDIGPVSLPPKDYVMIVVCIVVLVLVGLLLQRTRLGTAMRAVADEHDLAEASGVDVRQVILVTWVTGTALAALGGVLQGLSDKVVWDMGFTMLLLMFAAVLLGGLGTAYGAMVGGLLIGVVTEVSTYWIESKYKLGVALGVLIIVVLLRPQGLLGHPERIG